LTAWYAEGAPAERASPPEAAPPEAADGAEEPGGKLLAAAEAVVEKLKAFKPVVLEGMDPSLHYLPPHVPKATWEALGDMVAANEKTCVARVDGSSWISLRLDGCGFSKAVRSMRSKGILEEGFSDTFASCMCECLRGLMEHFNARVGYTQSDEMCIFIPPTNVVRGERQPHVRGGRVTKITTLAASLVTAHFLMQLCQKCQQSGVGLEGLAQVLSHFDCRLGHYDSWEEARALLMWRAYDCSVNGVSDAVYQIKGSGKDVRGAGKREKVEWLWKQGHLPLPRHQAYGTVLARVKRVVEGHNPKSGESTKTLRGRIEQVEGPVLELVRSDSLLPKDEELE